MPAESIVPEDAEPPTSPFASHTRSVSPLCPTSLNCRDCPGKSNAEEGAIKAEPPPPAQPINVNKQPAINPAAVQRILKFGKILPDQALKSMECVRYRRDREILQTKRLFHKLPHGHNSDSAKRHLPIG